MSKQGRGYSQSVVAAVEAAVPALLVTQFAKLCSARRVSAIEVAQSFGVSRATVYNWFTGVFAPKPQHIEKMREALAAARGTGA